MNFDQPLKKLSGDELKDSDGKTLTLKWACTEALLGHYPKEDIDGTEKMARFILAKRISEGGDIELKAEEITKLKKLVALNFAPLIVGQVWQMIDPAESK